MQIFADDISAAISHEHRQTAIELAHVLIAVLLKHLSKTDLDVSLPKCQNFLVEGSLEETREGPREMASSHNQRLREQNRQRMSQDLRALEKSEEKEGKGELPFPWTYSFRLLGVILDCHWHFREHFRELQKKAVKRLHIVKRVAGTVWGMESRILAVTVHALIESIVGYGLACTGGHVSRQVLDKVDAGVLNIAARKVLGANISARKEVLYALADVNNVGNHLVLKTANMLDRVLRSTNTAAQKTAAQCLKGYLHKKEEANEGRAAQRWEDLDPQLEYRTKGETKGRNKNLKEEECDLLRNVKWEITTERWRNGERSPLTQTSIYDANLGTADLLRDTPQLLYTRHRKKTGAYEMALAILLRVGWSPSVVYDKRLYPRYKSGINWSKMHWETTAGQAEESVARENCIYVYATPLDIPGLAAGVTVIRKDQREELRWTHVFGSKIIEQPICLEGMNLVRSIELLTLILEKEEQSSIVEQGKELAIAVCSNYLANMSGHTMMRWKQHGAPYEPLPAQDSLNRTLSEITQSATIKAVKIAGVPKDCSIVRATKILSRKEEARQLQKAINNKVTGGGNLPVFWCTQTEVKALLKKQQEGDEQAVIRTLATLEPQPSMSCSIYTEWNLNRERVRRSLRRLSYDRMLQVTFGGIISATRFKILEGKNIGDVKCPKCGKLDRWEHCKECYQIQIPNDPLEENWLIEMDKVMNKLCTPNPAMNAKYTATKDAKNKGRGKVKIIKLSPKPKTKSQTRNSNKD